MITYGSVCSGIEAASVAWHPLGWEPEWFAEIESFPSAVLAHHYPNVPNLGDMTTIAAKIRSGLVRAPDILVGGTPCQAFSIAGLRNSMGDARGQLSLSFVDLANAIDSMRAVPSITVWENVPGVLSTKDNAFGCFLAGLAGEDDPLVTPGGKWPNAGCVYGPRRTIAWRVLDAQYFGVAQRRRRVFVVASARDGFDPAAVLFEFDGVRRDIAPRRESRQEITGTLGARDSSSGRGVERTGETRGQDPVVACVTGDVSHTLRAEGFDASEDGTGRGTPIICMAHGQGGAEIRHDSCPTLTCNYEAPIAAYAIQPVAFGGNNQSGSIDVATACNARVRMDFESETFLVQENKFPGPDIIGTLNTNGKAAGSATSQDAESGMLIPVLGYSTSGAGYWREGIGALRARSDSHESVTLSVSLRGREGGATAELGDEVSTCLRASGGGGDKAHVLAPHAATDMQVRRLTPMERERLQGFPDNYTLIPVRGKPPADGPRYRALGNSMAVPVMAFIGRKIQAAIQPSQE